MFYAQHTCILYKLKMRSFSGLEKNYAHVLINELCDDQQVLEMINFTVLIQIILNDIFACFDFIFYINTLYTSIYIYNIYPLDGT